MQEKATKLIGLALLARQPQEPVGENPAREEPAQLANHEARQAPTLGLDLGPERLQGLGDHTVENALFRAPALVGPGHGDGRARKVRALAGTRPASGRSVTVAARRSPSSDLEVI